MSPKDKKNNWNLSEGTKTNGFTLVSVLFLIAIIVGLLAVVAASISLGQRTAGVERDIQQAKRAALFGLETALGELQAAAGPDQRITATASIINSSDNIYTGGLNPAIGQHSWTGVWASDTESSNAQAPSYNPADPNTREFVGWLVSSSDAQGNFKLPAELEDVTIDTASTPASFGGLDNFITLRNKSDGSAYLQAKKVEIDRINKGTTSSTERVLRKRYFAFAVEDEGVKADLSWNENQFSPAGATNKLQRDRLSSSPGPDYSVFNLDTGPFEGLQHPFSFTSSGQNQDIEIAVKSMRDPVDLAVLLDAEEDWIIDTHEHVTWGSRGVLSNVKTGGLRRDLSLAFEMDDLVESESAVRFNRQVGEFVGGTDGLGAVQNAPGLSIPGRYLYRDLPDVGNPFSDHITQPKTVVRGPSWWAMRDFATLYKHLRTVDETDYLTARAYYPNRTTRGDIEDNLFDLHAQKNRGRTHPNTVIATNRETNEDGAFAYKPVRASYAPVLLGVNAIYSLAYRGGQLEMVVDPFFILWNPYDIGIESEKFAVTLHNGLTGGVRFRITDPTGRVTNHGRQSRWGNSGTDTAFYHYAQNKSGDSADLSYMITNLSMGPGEVKLYSPPSEDERSDNATVLNDELLEGMKYNATDSGIVFENFPDENGSNWQPIRVPQNQSGDYKIEVLFNILSQNAYAINNFIETTIPDDNAIPKDLKDAQKHGDAVQGKEFRLNLGGGEHSTNVDTGTRGFSLEYRFSELSGVKTSFGILSMLVAPTDYDEADTALEVYSQINALAPVTTNTELFRRAPFNVVVKTVPANGINNLMNEVGIDIDAFQQGENGFYGKNYSLADGDSVFPLLSIPRSPPISLIQFSSANLGTRLFEPTQPIGNSIRPPYIPKESIYYGSGEYFLNWSELTMHDSSWLINDALFDQYYLSGIGGVLSDSIDKFFEYDPLTREHSPALSPYVPTGKTIPDIVEELLPQGDNDEGYKKLAAYSLINGAFNINSTSIPAWAGFLQGNRQLSLEFTGAGGSEQSDGTPFPLHNTLLDVDSNNGWELFSRLTDDQIWNDNGTPTNFEDDTGLAAEIVNQVKTRGPFMSLSDFVNRRISDGPEANRGAIQEAIEASGINGNQTEGIRAQTSAKTPNYSNYSNLFPFADPESIGDRNNATGVPLEINQANVLLPLAPRMTARSDKFKIRAYGEVRDGTESEIISQVACEAVVQRLPEYFDSSANEPWDDHETVSELNQRFGRKFKIVQFRWIDPDEL